MTSHDNLVFRQNVVAFAMKTIKKIDPATLNINSVIGFEMFLGGPEFDALVSSYIHSYKRGSIFMTANIRRKNSDLNMPFELAKMEMYYNNTKIEIFMPSGLSDSLAMDQCLGDIVEQVIKTGQPAVKFARVDGILRPMRFTQIPQ